MEASLQQMFRLFLLFASDDYLSALFVLECLEHEGGNSEQGDCPSATVEGPGLSPSGSTQHPAGVPLNQKQSHHFHKQLFFLGSYKQYTTQNLTRLGVHACFSVTVCENLLRLMKTEFQRKVKYKEAVGHIYRMRKGNVCLKLQHPLQKLIF